MTPPRYTKRFTHLWVGFLFAIGAAGCGGGQPAPPAEPTAKPAAQSAAPPRARVVRPFPDFGFLPPPHGPSKYSGPVFKLSQDYPKTKPDGLPPFMQTDFRTDWRGYMSQVRDYCFEGNVNHATFDEDFRAENNTSAAGTTCRSSTGGRAVARAFTDDQGSGGPEAATGGLADLHRRRRPTRWAVQRLAGYTIGQVWDDDDPVAKFSGVTFPFSATVCKVLFVDVPPDQVPSLANPLQWNAYTTTTYQTQGRHMTKVSLIQMDIMVRDSRSPTLWVMGTFQYNGQLNNPKRWNNLVPVGLMFGNDPTITDSAYSNPSVAKTMINPALKETIINPTADCRRPISGGTAG